MILDDFFALFCIFCDPGAVFRLILAAGTGFFSFFFSISKFYHFFSFFGRPRDPPGHQKPMIFMVLSSKIKVSRISKKSVLGVTFGSLGEHFGHHFGRLFAPWGSFGRPLDSQSGAKVEKRVKKERKNEVLNRPGRPEGPKGRQRRPRPSKMNPKSLKNRRKNYKKNILQQPTLQERIGWIDRLRARISQKIYCVFNMFLS